MIDYAALAKSMAPPPRKMFIPREYQVTAMGWAYANPKCGLFLRMGLGKTVATLTVIRGLVKVEKSIRKVLVIAPKLVAEQVWTTEGDLWEHLADLQISVITGSAKERREVMEASADVYVISRDQVSWLVDEVGVNFDYDMVVIDESSSFKSAEAQKFKKIKRVIGYAQRVILLTGTPAPNGLLDLWAQINLLDGGFRLMPTFEAYRAFFFSAGSKFKTKHGNLKETNYQPRQGAEIQIWNKISDICLSMQTADYLKLPELIEVVHKVKLPPEAAEQYRVLERDMLLSLPEADIVAGGAAALTNKLLQVSLGTAYDEDGNSRVIHSVMLDALAEKIEQADSPVLVFYQFTQDRDRMLERFKDAEHLTDSKQIRRWNAGNIPILIAHPASAGHGLNLQYGGNFVIWYGLTWNLELFEQANTRVYRQGQSKDVTTVYLIPEGSLHEEVLARLEGKAFTQDSLMEALCERRKKYFTALNG